MSAIGQIKAARRLRRHRRIRKTVQGSAARPRLAVFRSLNHIYAQVIDDVAGATLCAASSTQSDVVGEGGTGNRAAAERVGEAVAKRALEKGVKTVVFDRGGFIYHGRVKSLADAARKAGLVF
ncbi:MAG TPA: 50S ribosomal protein L18 [Planctomycetota bacterium]|nr:50S ribosomal protein L18 [Planctomycetota bacterium]